MSQNVEENSNEGEKMSHIDNAYHINNCDEENVISDSDDAESVSIDSDDDEECSIKDDEKKFSVKEDGQCIIKLDEEDDSASEAEVFASYFDDEEEERNRDMYEEYSYLEEADDNNSDTEHTHEDHRARGRCSLCTGYIDPCSSCIELSQLLINTAIKNNINLICLKKLPLTLHKFHLYCGTKMTILHAACLINNLQLVKLFVEDGEDVNAQTRNLYSPMHALLNHCEADTKIVRYLISHGADVTLMNYLSETPLDIGARASCLPPSSKAWRHSPNAIASVAFNATSRRNAASANLIEIIDILLASGADPDQSVIRFSLGNMKVFKHILEKTDLSRIKCENIKFLLDSIMRKNTLDCLEVLLNSNCCKEFCLEEERKFYSEYTKICWIGYLFSAYIPIIHSFNSWKKMLHLMLKYGFSINSKSPECIPPLCVVTNIPSAYAYLSPYVITEFIRCGADVNYPNALTPEALLYSCRCSNSDVMLLLLKHSYYATPDSVLNGYIEVDRVFNIAPKVIELFLKLGVKQSSIRLLSSIQTVVPDYYNLTGHICTLKQLSRIAVRHFFYVKENKSCVDEIMKKLPRTICKYIKYETEKFNKQLIEEDYEMECSKAIFSLD